MFDCNKIVQKYGATHWREFAFFSANVQQVLGCCETAVQYALYETTKTFIAEQAAFDLRDIKNYPGVDFKSCIHAKPSFLLAYHYGHYRLLPILLLQQGRKIAVVVSASSVVDQQRYYATVMQQCWVDRLVFVLAEDSQLFFKLRKLTQQGYDVLCYMDGGSGVRVDHQNHRVKCLDVSLLDAVVSVRRGGIDMAYLLDTPVFLLRSQRDTDSARIILAIDSVDESPQESLRQDFVKSTLQKSYAVLGRCIHKAPSQWETWRYMHWSMHPRSYRDRFPDHDRYIPFQLNDSHFLLDKKRYRIFPMDEGQYRKAWQKFMDWA